MCSGSKFTVCNARSAKQLLLQSSVQPVRNVPAVSPQLSTWTRLARGLLQRAERARRMQEGVRPAVGLFLAAAALAGGLSLLLPIETKGRELAEDAAELELQRLEDKASTASSTLKPMGAATYSTSLTLAPHSAATSNPFHTEDLAESAAMDDGAARVQLERT